jgi:p-aminobenzoyl-glutamate transporter AbgT
MRDPLGTLTSLKQLDPGFKVAWNETGLSVIDIAAGKPAAAAGLQNNDLITRLGTKEVTGEEQFWTEFGKLKERKPVSMEISRNGTQQELTYTPVMGGGAPLMGSIVPLIFVLFVIPGVVHGYVSGKFRSHRDVIKGMSKSMESMAYYLVLVFFAAMFIYVFTRSDIGVLLAVKGANLLEGRPVWQIICGVILLTATVNLLIGSASAKWAMLSPIFVPMLMLLGISPEFTQAAYRVGDSTTNIITPMMPYFPLVVVYCQKYFTKTGIGTVTSMMLPYSLSFLVLWSLFLLVYWQIGIPLGIGGSYEYVTPDAVPAGGQTINAA